MGVHELCFSEAFAAKSNSRALEQCDVLAMSGHIALCTTHGLRTLVSESKRRILSGYRFEYSKIISRVVSVKQPR